MAERLAMPSGYPPGGRPPARWVSLARGVLLAAVVVGAPVLLASRYLQSEAESHRLPGLQVIRPPHEVSALALEGNRVWAGGEQGVWAIDRRSGTIVGEVTAARPLRQVRALLVDSAGRLWIGHGAGLACHDPATGRTEDFSAGLPDPRVNCLLEDREGRLWVGTWGGAAAREGQGWQVLTVADGLAEDMVNVMLQDREGGLWFGSYVAPRGGLSRCAGGRWQRLGLAEGLPHPNVTSLLQDQGGSVWVGTGFFDRGGAAELRPRGEGWAIARVLYRRDGLAGPKVRSLLQDRAGARWFGSENEGVAVLSPSGTWRTLTRRDGLSHDEVKCMLQDPEGNLWLATRDGVTRLDAQGWRSLSSGDRPPAAP